MADIRLVSACQAAARNHLLCCESLQVKRNNCTRARKKVHPVIEAAMLQCLRVTWTRRGPTADWAAPSLTASKHLKCQSCGTYVSAVRCNFQACWVRAAEARLAAMFVSASKGARAFQHKSRFQFGVLAAPSKGRRVLNEAHRLPIKIKISIWGVGHTEQSPPRDQ